MSLIFGLPANVVYATAGIYALLVFATIVVWVSRLRTPGERYRELAARVDSWWWMIGAFTLAILFNQTVAIVFLGFIAYLALKEYLSLVPTRRIDRAVLLFAYLAIPGPDDDRLHAEPYGLAPRLGGTRSTRWRVASGSSSSSWCSLSSTMSRNIAGAGCLAATR